MFVRSASPLSLAEAAFAFDKSVRTEKIKRDTEKKCVKISAEQHRQNGRKRTQPWTRASGWP